MADFTAAERIEIFKCATRTFAHWYGKRFKEPMTDEVLEELLKRGIGHGGSSSSGPGGFSVWHIGLKIWGYREICCTGRGKPLFDGKQTIAMAREVYGIKRPGDAAQMSLL